MKNRILFLTFIEHGNFIGKAETLIGDFSLYGYLCFCLEDLQSKAKESTGKPFVLVDGNFVVVENGVAHHHGSSSEIAKREVIDNGGSLVENHVDVKTVVLDSVVVHRELVMLVKHHGG